MEEIILLLTPGEKWMWIQRVIEIKTQKQKQKLDCCVSYGIIYSDQDLKGTSVSIRSQMDQDHVLHT